MKTPFKMVYYRVYPSEEQQKEIVKFIEESIINGIEEFKQTFTSKKGIKIMQFFMLPKTDLHQLFKDEIISKYHEYKINKNTNEVKQEMKNTINKLKRQYPDDSFKYEYLNKFSTTNDKFVRLTIPVLEQGKIKRYGTTVISQKHTPNLYLLYS